MYVALVQTCSFYAGLHQVCPHVRVFAHVELRSYTGDFVAAICLYVRSATSKPDLPLSFLLFMLSISRLVTSTAQSEVTLVLGHRLHRPLLAGVLSLLWTA